MGTVLSKRKGSRRKTVNVHHAYEQVCVSPKVEEKGEVIAKNRPSSLPVNCVTIAETRRCRPNRFSAPVTKKSIETVGAQRQLLSTEASKSECIDEDHDKQTSFQREDATRTLQQNLYDDPYLEKGTSTQEEGYCSMDCFAKGIDEIGRLGCFYDIDREYAEEWLSEKTVQPGTYLLRPSNDEGHFALSVRCHGGDGGKRVCHYRLKIGDNKICYIDTDGEIGRPFINMQQLIEYYSEHHGLRNKLTVPYAAYSKEFLELEIKRDDLVLRKKLGAGHFATVYEGTLGNGQSVAVKSLNIGGSLSTKDLLDEAFVMHQLRHDRLVMLIGFCVDDEKGRVHLVMDQISRGALKDLLLKDGGKVINLPCLMNMAIQVAEGMSYLESQKFVHRDLRAANVLVTDSYDVKIADFGLARLLDKYYKNVRVYSETKDVAFPFKWTAPEALKKLQFTVKSDVWSFGILLYEIFTFGEEIYLGKSNSETVEWVIAGNRLQQPTEHCPDSMYSLMLDCWNEEPAERPTFQSIKDTLETQSHESLVYLYRPSITRINPLSRKTGPGVFHRPSTTKRSLVMPISRPVTQKPVINLPSPGDPSVS